MAQYRVAIIGCGGLGRRHTEGYKASPHCEVVAAADIQRERVDAFCQEHGIQRAYLDYHTMLEQEAPDIVSVCVARTPRPDHDRRRPCRSEGRSL